MAEDLIIPEATDKRERYKILFPQIEALVSGETDIIANLANIAAALKQGMGFFWVGFYRVEGAELLLGPFQGPVACTRIRSGKGVCGTAFAEKRVVLVKDVTQFPGHIACSSGSRSEIVLPALKDGAVKLILDIDSDKLNDFDAVDKRWLMKVITLIESFL